jgi:hypothetical protein
MKLLTEWTGKVDPSFVHLNMINFHLTLIYTSALFFPLAAITILAFIPHSGNCIDLLLHLLKAEVKVKIITIDGYSTSLSWCEAPIWGPQPELHYRQTIAGLLIWGAFSDERTGL